MPVPANVGLFQTTKVNRVRVLKERWNFRQVSSNI
jgi:hypothetical protein